MLNLDGIQISSKNSMNVLGVTFNSKLNWQIQVQRAITNSKKALHGINLIKKFFNKNELLKKTTSNYYSVLHYNNEIWLIPSLCHNSKKNLLNAAAALLKLCVFNFDRMMSFERLHTIT